jgi:hypothetical protein
MIASARMYAWAPSLVTAWRRLLQGVTARAGVALDFVDSRAVALDELWAREDLGCVFMCGYPDALRADRPALLAAPVPSPARFGGKAVYVTDFIVRADGPHQQLADTFGDTIAYSTAHSHSGYNAARYHLLWYRSAQRPALFTQVKGPHSSWVGARRVTLRHVSSRPPRLAPDVRLSPHPAQHLRSFSMPITEHLFPFQWPPQTFIHV